MNRPTSLNDLDADYALHSGLTRDERRYILDPKDICSKNFPGESFGVLNEEGSQAVWGVQDTTSRARGVG